MRGSPFGFTNFSRGLNVLDSPYTLNDGEARDCLNMVSSPRGAIKKRYGSTVFASGAAPYFPTLPVTDSFIRANEEPLKKDGKGNENAWQKIPTFTDTTGQVLNNVWQNSPGVNTAYYSVAEQTNPAVSIEPVEKQIGGGENLSLITCMDATGKKFYEANCTMTSEAKLEHFISLYRRDNVGVETQLGSVSKVIIQSNDKIGLTVRAGQVTFWVYTKATTTWTPVLTAADATYTKGYSGISGLSMRCNNFSVGEATVPPAETEFTSLLPCQIGGVNYLIAVSGKKIFSITEVGEITDITGPATVTEGLRWSIIQSTAGSPNRVSVDGPIYLSNGVDQPLTWSGASKSTLVGEWTSKPEGTFVAVPKAKYLTYLGNRVWASGISGDTSALRFSGFAVKVEEGEQPDPTNWPKENIVWFEKDDGQPITGTGIAGSYLMVFKKHKTWAVYDLNEGENRRLSDNVGCISYRSIVETPQGTFFLTPDQGVYVTNGTSLREVSRNVRPILQGTDPVASRAAKLDQLENTAAGYLNGHYYLSYRAQDGSMKTLDYDTQLQSWWLHDLAGNQWVAWEPKPGTSSLYTIPAKAKTGVIKAFVTSTYQDAGVNYVGGNGLSCYWLSSWEPFFQYVLRHRINQPQTKKRVRELFVDGKGELVSLVARKFGAALEVLKGTVDNADMAGPTSPLTLGTAENETQAARYYALGTSRVWSFGFGNASAEPLEVDTYAVDLSFRKS